MRLDYRTIIEIADDGKVKITTREDEVALSLSNKFFNHELFDIKADHAVDGGQLYVAEITATNCLKNQTLVQFLQRWVPKAARRQQEKNA